ncbi:MAG: hypothetical protein KDC35_11550 [Acidobacteria bacterium]|nr:hypothetical protein [Acidobacteriota bacterium]
MDFRNPALLKLALYCEGMRIDPEARNELESGREIMRTRAGLGSGLELIIPPNLWTNVPVEEPFCQQSPFVFHIKNGNCQIVHEPSGQAIEVALAPRPEWYDASCSTGKAMTSVGTLQGTYLGIYPTKVCEFWQGSTKENCKFCSVGLNLGNWDAPEKRLDEVIEVVERARNSSKITYVDFNTGHYEDESYLDVLEPILIEVKKRTGLLIGVQTPPHSNLDRYRRLRDLGVNRVSFCFEIYNPERFSEICPGKERFYGLDRYLETMDFCASLSSRQSLSEPWVTNGEIIAGLEPAEWSIKAIDRICSVGAIPTVCVFRPLIGTAYEHLDPPKTNEMIPVFRHLYEQCMSAGLPIGLAPNIHVSLVMLPEECAHLSPQSNAWSMVPKKLGLGVKRWVFSSRFQKKLAVYDHRRQLATAAVS